MTGVDPDRFEGFNKKLAKAANWFLFAVMVGSFGFSIYITESNFGDFSYLDILKERFIEYPLLNMGIVFVVFVTLVYGRLKNRETKYNDK